MQYLELTDFDPSIRQELRQIVADDSVMNSIIYRTVFAVRSHIGRKYDLDHEFSKTGNDRNPELVKIMVDICIYDMFMAISPRMIPETRKNANEYARDWLKRVALPDDNEFCIFPLLQLRQEGDGMAFKGDSGLKYGNRF